MNYLRLNMTTPQKVVLLACGSFNPPTNMHLRMFELGRDHLQRGGKYNVIAGIMSPVSDGYNKKDLVSAKHRCAMVKLAIKSSKWIRMDTWECEQPDWTETAKVLSHHQLLLDNQANTQVKFTPSKKRKKDKRNEEFIDRVNSPSQTNNKEESEHENVQLKLLCGGDLLESFAVPGLWADDDIEEIVKKYGLVCVTRNGSDPRKFIYESDVLSRNQDNIHIVTEWIQNEISSTKIRRALRRDESVKYLIQDSVIDYIREHELYGLKCDNKYIEKATPSPMSDIIEYVDDGLPNESITIISTRESLSRSPRRSVEKLERTSSSVSMSPRRLLSSSAKLSRSSSPSSSPKRMVDDDEPESDRSNSPKTTPVCMSDIGTIVRRVRNYNLHGIFQPKKIQPK
ncbi:nicotinamide/nicotinic acid mononucleotide adenylyltransferase 1-like isoform X3 [Mercenaria mercenaria]|uniref:nicotinamide/nicotinic acid mononucleotide adenylyltransferase 1-like isoform X3 n=1 Tax=Mercenaria mercenaria TaxID=6596 RepID=UPI00234F99EE|nr:nicotinamide/nicotinic acid mononucleotide adenylyltransferase 1-like isoform X3 [Mercenaria mercenaria]